MAQDEFGISGLVQKLEQAAYRKSRNAKNLKEAKALLSASIAVVPTQAHITELRCACGSSTRIFTGLTKKGLTLSLARQGCSIWQTNLIGDVLPTDCELIITTQSAAVCADCISAQFE